jgi:hypothetical protein
MRLRIFLAVVVVVLLVALLSAGRFTHTRQCRALIAAVNPTLDEVQRRTQTNPDKAAYLEAAVRFEKLAAALGPLEFSSREMAEDVADYANQLRATARALRSVSAAPDAKDSAELDKTNRELERLEARVRQSIGKMDAWCQAS